MILPQTEVIISANGAELGRYTVTPGEYVIGREGDIPVEAELVSRRHALLSVNYGDWLIQDLGSTNGTQLNGQPVSGATRVWPSQKIQIGAATIELRRLQTQPADGQSLSPQAASVRRYLPPEFLRGSKYVIDRPIAQGGMGAILAAQEAGLRRPVAMKVMLESGGESDLVRFIEEAQITGQLQHPNIVPVYELGVDEHDQVFYTMKLVEGTTLKKVLELLRARIPEVVEKYPLNALLTLFLKVCDALAYAHAKHVIHRDLKPENLMIGSFGEVLVMDWGLAKVLRDAGAPVSSDSVGGIQEFPTHTAAHLRGVALSSRDAGAVSTLAGTIMGTPHFMSPEQASGEIDRLDARSDIFSLGAILYQILTLELPFQGRTVEEVLENVRRCEVMPPQRAALARAERDKLKTKPEVPSALAAVAMKALSLRPEDRYQTVTELQREIEAYQAGFATAAEKAGAWKQFTLFVRRNKAASIGVAAVLLIGGTFGTKAVVEGRRATQALADLRGTAPTFAAQAAALIEAQKFDEALEKLGFAIRLDPENADYHIARAHALQAVTRLPDAVESYRATLALRPGDSAAKTNLSLCETLLTDNGGHPELTIQLKNRLLDAIIAQKRQHHAIPLSRELKRDSDTAETLIKTRLKAIIAQPGWTWQKLVRLADGTFQLDLRGQKVPDLSILEDLAITVLDISDLSGLDLTPLRKVPLRSLAIRNWSSGSLEGLRGMKLTNLDAGGSKLTDFSSLAGMPLERLVLDNTWIKDLSPLRGMPLAHLDLKWVSGPIDTAPLQGLPLRTLIWHKMPARSLVHLKGAPLETLVITNSFVETLDGLQGAPLRTLLADGSKITDISALRGSALVEADLAGNPLTDLTPLAACPKLERLLLPGGTSDIAFLQKLPKLGRIGFGNLTAYTNAWNRVPTAEEFWKKNGERLARQVPMEKQLEKFRQSLIAQGNDPEKVLRYAFDNDGQLSVRVQSPAVWKCVDISELRGVAVTGFYCDRPITNIAPLAGAPLENLLLNSPGISDLSPLRGAPLVEALLGGTGVADLSPLRGMPLRKLAINKTAVSDVAILAEFPTLEEVILPAGAKNVEALRRLPKLARIAYNGIGPGAATPAQTAAEFWKEFDAKKAAGKQE